MTDLQESIVSADQTAVPAKRKPTRVRVTTEWLKTLPDYPLTMTRQELATILHVTPDTLRNWDHAKIGPPALRVSYKQIIYTRDDVLAFLDAQRNKMEDPTIRQWPFQCRRVPTSTTEEVIAKRGGKPSTMPAHLAFRKKEHESSGE